MTQTTTCGYIALCGRPNVGKSTLLNQLLGQKISITSSKPQTTRHRLLGIDTIGRHQLVFVDTPGIHKGEKKALNRYMNKAADSVIRDVDVIAMVVDGLQWKEEDELVLERLQNSSIPVILVINKIDQIKDKSLLLPHIESLRSKLDFHAVVPLSAKTGKQVDSLREVFYPLLPESPHLFDDDQVTDRPIRFLVAEMVREKLFRLCGQELPYSITVEIEEFDNSDKVCNIAALVLVDKEAHKRMIIGNKGDKLKQVGMQARLDMERMLEKKVFLRLWCKVKSGWADNERALQSLGYDALS